MIFLFLKSLFFVQYLLVRLQKTLFAEIVQKLFLKKHPLQMFKTVIQSYSDIKDQKFIVETSLFEVFKRSK